MMEVQQWTGWSKSKSEVSLLLQQQQLVSGYFSSNNLFLEGNG